MDNGFTSSDAVLTSAMSGGFGGGIGGGGWGNRGGASFADLGSNAVRMESGQRATAAGIENLLDQNQFTSTNKNIVDGFSSAADSRAANVNRVSDTMANAEFRTSDRLSALKDGQFAAELRTGDKVSNLERTVVNGQRDADKCCCDLKLQSCEDKAQILAAIAANSLTACQDKAEIMQSIAAGTATTLAAESRGIERTLNATQAELISLRTQVACNCNCPS